MSGHARLPDDDYTVVENYFFDHVMPRVSPAEWKIICAVIRETVGWRCGISAHPKSCRQSEAEISTDRFMALTGMASEALCAAIGKVLKREVVRRRTQQVRRQRTFHFSAVPRANLQSLESEPDSIQEALPFVSDFGNRNPTGPDRISEIETPTAVSDFGNRNPTGPVLRSIKKDQDLKKHSGSDANPWATNPWTEDDVFRHVDDCIAEGQSISREATIKAILRDKTAVDHKLIADRLEKIAARAAWIRERKLQSKADTPQAEPAPPNWRGTPLEEVVAAASQTVSAETIRDWFWQLRFEGLSEDGTILASAPAVVRDWLKGNYSALLKHPDGRPVRLVQLQQKGAAA